MGMGEGEATKGQKRRSKTGEEKKQGRTKGAWPYRAVPASKEVQQSPLCVDCQLVAAARARHGVAALDIAVVVDGLNRLPLCPVHLPYARNKRGVE